MNSINHLWSGTSVMNVGKLETYQCYFGFINSGMEWLIVIPLAG
jgi:hypothetical protein